MFFLSLKYTCTSSVNYEHWEAFVKPLLDEGIHDLRWPWASFQQYFTRLVSAGLWREEAEAHEHGAVQWKFSCNAVARHAARQQSATPVNAWWSSSTMTSTQTVAYMPYERRIHLVVTHQSTVHVHSCEAAIKLGALRVMWCDHRPLRFVPKQRVVN